MKLSKCFFCNKITYCPVHLTEVHEDGTVEICDMCAECGETYMKELENPKDNQHPQSAEIIDLTHINTPQELLDFLSGVSPSKEPKGDCECGMTDENFEKNGRFGCPKCYAHFKGKMAQQVFPFHKADHHVGKKPKAHYLETLMQNPVEKMKILKLRYAKALELEQYEKAAEIKKEIDLLNAEQLP